MRRAIPIRPLAMMALGIAIMALPGHSEIIDRIAASVGNRVITASDLDRQIRVAAFSDGIKPDFSPEHKKAIVNAMIEQKLVESELANSRYPLPDPSELIPIIERFKKEHFKDEADYQASLFSYGISEDDFKELLLWQRTLILFIQVRFETGVQLGATEVEDYFTNTVKPAAEAAKPGQIITLEDFRDQIERTLTGRKADAQMDTWLRDVRRRTNVVIHEEVLK